MVAKIQLYVQSPASERKLLHILNKLSGTIDSKREWRIHTYITNIWVLNPVYKYGFIDFQNYLLKADFMWLKQTPGEYVLMRVTVHELLYKTYYSIENYSARMYR